MTAGPARMPGAAKLCIALALVAATHLTSSWLPIAAHPARRGLADEAATAAAEGMLTRLNTARQANGLQPYRSSPLLAEVAAAHAREVAEHNHYSHTGLDGRSAKQRMADAGYGAGHGGVRTSENFVARSELDDAFNWLMEDKDHRPNMLDARFREVGVGVAPTRYGFVWVLDFGTFDGVDDVPTPTAPPTPTVPPTPPPATATVAPSATAVFTATAAATATELLTSTVALTSTATRTSTTGATLPTRSPLPTAEPQAPTGGFSATSVGIVVLGLLVVVGLLAWASTRQGAMRRR